MSWNVTPLTNDVQYPFSTARMPTHSKSQMEFCEHKSYVIMAIFVGFIHLYTWNGTLCNGRRGEWKVSEKKLQYIDYVRLVDCLTRVWKHRSTHVILCQCYSCAFMFQQHLRMEFTQQIILMISHFRAFYAPSLSIYP